VTYRRMRNLKDAASLESKDENAVTFDLPHEMNSVDIITYAKEVLSEVDPIMKDFKFKGSGKEFRFRTDYSKITAHIDMDKLKHHPLT
jgi:hypothetical protein